jgi:4'-phosphopantetheinyl transferase superfamily
MNVIELPESWRGRAIVVSGEPPDDVVAPDSCRTDKRRREWRLSRAAARLLPDRAYVSYSHSEPYAAAAKDDVPVGIDVQVIRPMSERALHLYLSDAEAAAARACMLRDALLHFWCAKEAAFKRRFGETVTLKQTPIQMLAQRDHGLVFDVVETVAIGDVIVALTRPTS